MPPTALVTPRCSASSRAAARATAGDGGRSPASRWGWPSSARGRWALPSRCSPGRRRVAPCRRHRGERARQRPSRASPHSWQSCCRGSLACTRSSRTSCAMPCSTRRCSASLGGAIPPRRTAAPLRRRARVGRRVWALLVATAPVVWRRWRAGARYGDDRLRDPGRPRDRAAVHLRPRSGRGTCSRRSCRSHCSWRSARRQPRRGSSRWCAASEAPSSRASRRRPSLLRLHGGTQRSRLPSPRRSSTAGLVLVAWGCHHGRGEATGRRRAALLTLLLGVLLLGPLRVPVEDPLVARARRQIRRMRRPCAP
jgi:hypothetical protein